MKLKSYEKRIIPVLLCAVFFSGCLARRKTREPVSKEHSRHTLEEKIDSPLIHSFLSNPQLEVYEVAERKSNYDQITVDFYKSPSFGLFTPYGKKRGREFINEYENYLHKAVTRFNLGKEAVPVISTLAGIEYSWGRLNPPYKVFNSLYSVYKQIYSLENFALRNINGLIDGIENPSIKIDPFSPSSFMGAVGYCQLMPMWFSTITERNLEDKLDLDGSGVFDPFSMPDAIAFFAWYLSESGFRRDPWNAVKLYNGRGPAAEAFADAVMEFSEKIQS